MYGFEPPSGCWELKLGPLSEQLVFLTVGRHCYAYLMYIQKTVLKVKLYASRG